jgi:hypothetical protein
MSAVGRGCVNVWPATSAGRMPELRESLHATGPGHYGVADFYTSKLFGFLFVGEITIRADA